ncbi:NRAMP family [Dillenia turbinata]|uniref:NRAMP family n=1 Tax=Dillenia turbinata TaxID=194707 RepID=A0AAN8WDC5_9MAGN
MEVENRNANQMPDIFRRLSPAVVPVLLISIGYVDPGKWATVVEGGARFGFDLIVPVLLFSFAAILCQYLSACIGVVTGRDLAQICSEEYDRATCIFLGVQTELSLVALDLTMILGIAQGLSLVLGIDSSTCVFLTAIDAVLFPVVTNFLENCQAKIVWIILSGFILLCYVLGVLFSQPEIPLSMNGMMTKLSGESAFALMGLLGASIMPHNFYLHSSIVQHQLPPNLSKNALCHEHFWAVVCIFSGIFLVNYVMMNSAANVFYGTGLVLFTIQDAMSLMDQVLRSSVVPFAFVLLLILSSQITTLTWNLSRQVVLQEFFKIDVAGWLHRFAIRIIAIVPAYCCSRNFGAEGIYQLLIYVQVMVALLLPSSVVPLFRVASSQSIMGPYKVSPFLEFLALITFITMLGLNIIFIVEMIFGDSDWVVNLRWNMGNTIGLPYVILLVIACASLGLTLWLAATPLKSASARIDSQMWDLDVAKSVSEASAGKEENDASGTKHHLEEPIEKREQVASIGRSLLSHSDILVPDIDSKLSETIISDQEPHLTTVEDICSKSMASSSSVSHLEESISTAESDNGSVVNEVSEGKSLATAILKLEPAIPVEKTLGVEGVLPTEKEDEEGETWEPEESSKGIHVTSPPTSEGPGSFRTSSGKSDEGGNGPGSLSRLSGLGRAARRQLAAVLDEFWGQLYDFHGQTTQEAKAKQFDVLLGIDLKPDTSTLKVDTLGKEDTGCFPSLGGRGSDSLIGYNSFDSPRQQRMQSSIQSSFNAQRGSSSLLTNRVELLDAYVQNSSRNVYDAGERRYHSLRIPTSSEGYDYQPATVHGYKIASYVDRITKDRNSTFFNGQTEILSPKTMPGPTRYTDTFPYASVQKPQNGFSSLQSLSIQNPAAPRNSPLQAERNYYDLFPPGFGENPGTRANSKKFRSMPDISGISLACRDLYSADRCGQLESPIGTGASVGRAAYDSMYLNPKQRAGAPLAFDELSPSNVYTDAFSLQLNSGLERRSSWSKQPPEQFGLAPKIHIGEDGVVSGPGLSNKEANSVVDMEVKLLQSFRVCILKLLKLEGSDWLFRQNDGADEDLIDRVAARERLFYEAEKRERARSVQIGDSHYMYDGKSGSMSKNDEAEFTKFLVSSVPHCGEGCIWKADLIVSFGVWCIHRILELSLMESRPELWGKYTYVLNRLQGIIDPAFFRPRPSTPNCFCLEIPVSPQRRMSPPFSNSILPPIARAGKGKWTTASTLLDIIKDVEIAISSRKGRSGTAAGDVAFPKGKENLVSVLKRYKRRLSNKPVSESGTASRKAPPSTSYGS